MRLVTLRTEQGTTAGRLDGDEIVELSAPDVGALLADADWRRNAAAQDGRSHRLDQANLAPVVTQPRKIMCLGLNYESHIKELGRQLPDRPTLFGKYARALIGPRDQIVLPAVAEQMDWEVELALVIGSEVRHADETAARAAIAGYTVLNDVSARDWQWATSQFLQGKTFEHTTPVGPALVTLDELDDPDDLEVRCEVDGRTMQLARTADLLFSPSEIVSYLSKILTLEPGDLIATGTPGGVGAGRKPPVFLQPGQVVRTVVEGVGELVNECVAESPTSSA